MAHAAARGTSGARDAGEHALRPALLAWLLAAVAAAVALLAAVLDATGGGAVSWKPLLLPLVWSLPGALIAAGRPRSALGWSLLGVAAMFAGIGLAQQVVGTAAPATAAFAVWYADRLAALIVPLATAALLLLPDGRLPSARWRLPVRLAVGGQVVLVLLWSLSLGPAADPRAGWSEPVSGLDNPVGVLPAAAAQAAERLEWLLQVPLLLAVLALAVRLRRADRDQRARLAVLLLAVLVFVAVALAGRAVWPDVADAVDVLGSLFLAVVLVAAVLRRSLEGVEVVVHHAFVATTLGALVVGVYVVVVGALAAAGPDLSRFGAGVVAALAAVLVQPLRARLQRAVDRLMHGDRRDPFAAVSRLAARTHRAPSVVEVLEAVAGSVATSLRAAGVRVEAFGLSAVVGDPARPGAGVCAALVAGDDEIGSVTAVPQPGRRFRADEARLLEELGRHAGIAVDSVRLAEEVGAHHRAVVQAREEERRRLGRELHDDLGPTVAGLSMQLGALRPLVRSDPDTVVARLAALESAATAALGDIRRVAHELRPPALDQVGLARAVRQVADSLDLTVVEEVVDHGPLPAAVEVAAYRIVAEALSNVARHSGARTVRLEIRELAGTLVVVVADQGRGPGGSVRGLGLATMRERAEELGGTLTVRVGDDGGTVVTGVLPLRTADEAADGRRRR